MSHRETERLTDYDRSLVEAFDAYQEHGNEFAASKALGINRTTMTNRLLRFFLRNLDGSLPIDVPPGHTIASRSVHLDADGRLKSQHIRTAAAAEEGDEYETPSGHRVKGESAYVDAQGRVLKKWVKTVEGERSDEVIAEAARLAAEKYVRPAAPVGPAPQKFEPDLLALHPLPDLHLGMSTTRLATGVDWSLPVAVETLREVMRALISRTPPCHTGAILGGGDLLHYDDETKSTRRSGNRLSGPHDYSYAEVLSEAQLLLVYQVELALHCYQRVVVRILPGNHDPDSAIAIAHFLKAWFRNEPRVEVDVDPSIFWFYDWGEVFLGATHGHEASINKMPGIMAADRREIWGRTRFVHAHGFHVHHATQSDGEEGGAQWETHRTPIPTDLHHHQRGYRSGRQLQTITYSKHEGEKGRSTEVLF